MGRFLGVPCTGTEPVHGPLHRPGLLIFCTGTKLVDEPVHGPVLRALLYRYGTGTRTGT